MLSFVSYACVSTCVTLLSLVYAYLSRPQFYPCVLFLTTHKLNVAILGNLAFFLLLLAGRLLKRLYLGVLSRDEVEELVSQSKYAITETCLALTVFREELNMRVLALFTGLLFVKIFHWLAVLRVEHLARTANVTWWSHVRLCALLLSLCVVDVCSLAALLSHLWSQREASVLLLFAFEFTILSVLSVSTLCKYGLHVVDARLEGRWQGKSLALFYLELVSDVLRLLLYLCFFMLICTYYGLPLHLIRELAITFYNLRERVVKFVNYRRITANMNQRFPDATAEELQAGDDVCIICREQMTSAKKLQCGHCFHGVCLRTWLERSSSCPTCRAIIAAPTANSNNNINSNGSNGSGSGSSAQAQPSAALPPLPPHLQAHIDRLRATREASSAHSAAVGRQQSAHASSSNDLNSSSARQGEAHRADVVRQPPSQSQLQERSPTTTSAPTPTPPHEAVTASPSLSAPPSTAAQSRFAPFMPLAGGHNSSHMPTDFALSASAAASQPSELSTQLPATLFFHTPHTASSTAAAAWAAAATNATFASPMPTCTAFSPQQWQHAALPAPLEPMYLAAFTHHTLTLQIHMELLESELRQLRLLWDRQLAVQDLINQQQLHQQHQHQQQPQHTAPGGSRREEGNDDSEASAHDASLRRRAVNGRDSSQQPQQPPISQQHQPSTSVD